MTIKVFSQNIHKGSSLFFYPVLSNLKEAITKEKADLVFLQEVQGKSKKIKESQFEFLADQIWPHFSYGKNAIKQNTDHGNAILSKFPILHWENRDVSSSALEKRGILYSLIKVQGKNVHIFCIHFSLLEKDRKKQMIELDKILKEKVLIEESVIIAGDFNDWSNSLTPLIIKEMNVKEAFITLEKKTPKTFPSIYPILSLDRVFYRNLEPICVKLIKDSPLSLNSDHLGLFVEFKI